MITDFKQYKSFSCKNCAANEFVRTVNNELQCSYCGTKYYIQKPVKAEPVRIEYDFDSILNITIPLYFGTLIPYK